MSNLTSDLYSHRLVGTSMHDAPETVVFDLAPVDQQQEPLWVGRCADAESARKTLAALGMEQREETVKVLTGLAEGEFLLRDGHGRTTLVQIDREAFLAWLRATFPERSTSDFAPEELSQHSTALLSLPQES